MTLPWTGPPAAVFRPDVTQNRPNICTAYSNGVNYYVSLVPSGSTTAGTTAAQSFVGLRQGVRPRGLPTADLQSVSVGTAPAAELRNISTTPAPSWLVELVVRASGRYITVSESGIPPTPQPPSATLVAVAQVLAAHAG